jgi:hypothetical protein
MGREATMDRIIILAMTCTLALGCGGKNRSEGEDGDTGISDASDTAGDVTTEITDVPSDEADPIEDTATDTIGDTTSDAVEDTVPDTVEDTGTDTAVDTAADTGADTPVDSSTDTTSCTPPETDCYGACVDMTSDDDHCGHCDTECLFDEECIASICEVMDWSTVGRAVNMGLDPATAHAIASDGTTPHVAMVLTDSWAGDVWVRRFDGLPAGWTDVGPTLVPVTLDARPVVDIEFAGTTPYVVHHNGTLARVRYFGGTNWDEVGAPGYTTMCMGLEALRFVLDGTDPHLTYMGAGGCGIGVGYFFHDATGWHHYPSTTSFPGTELITMDGNGVSDLAFTDRAYIATGDLATHGVRIWDTLGSDWTDHGSTLEMNADTGWGEDQAMTSDALGNLWVVWSEQDSVGVGSIFVKTWTTDWSLLGTGAANDGGDASRPSIAIID